MSNRTITRENLAEANRLRKTWDSRKKSLGLNQKDVAKSLGWTQGAISQYLNGHTALNTDTILTFARLLQISPNVIRPGVLDKIKNEEQSIMLYTTSGEEPTKEDWANIQKYSDKYLMIKIDTPVDVRFRIDIGELVIIDPNLKARSGDRVVELKGTTPIFKMWKKNAQFTGVVISVNRAP